MRCVNTGEQGQDWIAVTKPDIQITRSDVDTMVQSFEKVSTFDGKEIVTDFPIGAPASGPGVFSGLLFFEQDAFNMYITDVSLTQGKPRLWTATVTWTGIYEYIPIRYLQLQVSSGASARNLYKPPQTDVRTYVDTVESINGTRTKVATVRIPRLTVTETYVSSSRPRNSDIGKTGSPLNPPSEIEVPSVPNPLILKEADAEPDGWILITRSWKQVLSEDIYSVTDEWEYQPPKTIITV